MIKDEKLDIKDTKDNIIIDQESELTTLTSQELNNQKELNSSQSQINSQVQNNQQIQQSIISQNSLQSSVVSQGQISIKKLIRKILKQTYLNLSEIPVDQIHQFQDYITKIGMSIHYQPETPYCQECYLLQPADLESQLNEAENKKLIFNYLTKSDYNLIESSLNDIPNAIIPKNKFSSPEIPQFLINTLFAIDGKTIQELIAKNPSINDRLPNYVLELLESQEVICITGRLTQEDGNLSNTVGQCYYCKDHVVFGRQCSQCNRYYHIWCCDGKCPFCEK